MNIIFEVVNEVNDYGDDVLISAALHGGKPDLPPGAFKKAVVIEEKLWVIDSDPNVESFMRDGFDHVTVQLEGDDDFNFFGQRYIETITRKRNVELWVVAVDLDALMDIINSGREVLLMREFTPQFPQIPAMLYVPA